MNSQTEALAYLRQEALKFPEKITIRMSSGFDGSLIDTAGNELNKIDGVHCYKGEMKGDTLTLFIRYEDDLIILAVHEGRINQSRLSPLQQRLYHKASRIVREAKGASTDEYEQARALHDWIVLHSRYVRGTKPEGALASILLYGEGLCECYARTYLLLTRMAGLDCRFVSGSALGENHAWNLVRIKGTWVHVDCTHDDPVPDTPGRVQHIYFGMGDATISKDHSWQREAYPSCPSDHLWYALIRTPRFATLDDMAAALIRKARRMGGNATLDGYVEELAQSPHAAGRLLQEAVNKHRQSLGMETLADGNRPGFITLSTAESKD